MVYISSLPIDCGLHSSDGLLIFLEYIIFSQPPSLDALLEYSRDDTT